MLGESNWEHLKVQEKRHQLGEFLTRHNINIENRGRMVDWMIEVLTTF